MRKNSEMSFTLFVQIAGNQINSDGALAVFLCIKASETSRMREIDFSVRRVTVSQGGMNYF